MELLGVLWLSTSGSRPSAKPNRIVLFPTAACSSSATSSKYSFLLSIRKSDVSFSESSREAWSSSNTTFSLTLPFVNEMHWRPSSIWSIACFDAIWRTTSTRTLSAAMHCPSPSSRVSCSIIFWYLPRPLTGLLVFSDVAKPASGEVVEQHDITESSLFRGRFTI